jgi:Flp pilus assembly protein TadD
MDFSIAAPPLQPLVALPRNMPLHRLPLSLLLALALSCAGSACLAGPAEDLRLLISRGDLPGALVTADKALQAKPRDATLRFLRAVVLMDLHRDQEALALFTELTHEYPELPDPYNNLALLQARGGRLDEARLSLQHALLNDPHHHAARVNLGQIHLWLAAQAWEQAAGAPAADATLRRKLQALRTLLASEALAEPATGAAR